MEVFFINFVVFPILLKIGWGFLLSRKKSVKVTTVIQAKNRVCFIPLYSTKKSVPKNKGGVQYFVACFHGEHLQGCAF